MSQPQASRLATLDRYKAALSDLKLQLARQSWVHIIVSEFQAVHNVSGSLLTVLTQANIISRRPLPKLRRGFEYSSTPKLLHLTPAVALELVNKHTNQGGKKTINSRPAEVTIPITNPSQSEVFGEDEILVVRIYSKGDGTAEYSVWDCCGDTMDEAITFAENCVSDNCTDRLKAVASPKFG